MDGIKGNKISTSFPVFFKNWDVRVFTRNKKSLLFTLKFFFQITLPIYWVLFVKSTVDNVETKFNPTTSVDKLTFPWDPVDHYFYGS